MLTSTRIQLLTRRCDDGHPQTTNDICDSGLCHGCPVPTNDCDMAGTFDPLTQQCSAPTLKANGTACDPQTIDKLPCELIANTQPYENEIAK